MDQVLACMSRFWRVAVVELSSCSVEEGLVSLHQMQGRPGRRQFAPADSGDTLVPHACYPFPIPAAWHPILLLTIAKQPHLSR